MSVTNATDENVTVQRRLELAESPLARLQRMIEIRLVEDRIQDLFAQGLIPGTTHTSQGQEAVAVALGAATRPTDIVCCTYRGHGVALSLGILPESVLGEVLGRQIGCMGGLGGSMHLSDPAIGLLPTFAIVGAGVPVAVGAALQFATLKNDGVAVSVFGDGSTNIGGFHEGLNLAAVWNLPAVFLCENNLYGEYSPIATTTAVTDIALRATSYGMVADTVDGQDVDAMYESIRNAVDRARGGGGPTLIEAKTYRYAGHSRSDKAPYRPDGELDAWMKRDPIDFYATKLAANGELDGRTLDEIRDEQRSFVDDAAAAAVASPSGSIAQMFAHVLAPSGH
ncbi:MAG TPA: thiamine pyrophosphate-dependent dehydrogenase E1 component subunit alpha [Acidimicrobiales bacterium]|nr:thiamine pyrophosphate-dependent dehydrogenase E1 component subunit alpha [Acidimicrobiales bacterium]